MRFLQLRPGEGRRLLWLAAIGVAYAAATSIGDSIAQSVFVSRAGAGALPRMFLFKGLLDVAAAAVYVPLTRRRSAARVWRVALAIYIVTVLGARAWAGHGDVLSAYALYVGHECAWTILTIHWGVFILDAFDASQARRLFPVLFTSARLGGAAGGAVLDFLAVPLGAINLLFIAAACAAGAAALSLLGRDLHLGSGMSQTSLPAMPAVIDDGKGDGDPSGATAANDSNDSRSNDRAGMWARWQRIAASPLVRAIALSTGFMVLVRYGLRMVSIDHMSAAFHHDEDMLAGFLGWFATWANAIGAVLGVFVVPRIFTRLGVGAANLLYAGATVCAYGLLLWMPGLTSAALARFVNQQLKNALKTPLSTLFYGAEPPPARAPARAFIFGAVIPLATVITAGVFEAGRSMTVVAWIGAGVAVLFTAACALQNRRWRRRMIELLIWHLTRAPAPDRRVLSRVEDALAGFSGRLDSELMERIARGLATPDRRTRAVAEEVLAEAVPRRQAYKLLRRLPRPLSRK